MIVQKNFNAEPKRNQSRLDQPTNSGAKLQEISPILLEEKENVEGFSGSMKAKIKYKDVADAAHAAFESAACAADAARAAVELSRSESHDPDDQIPPSFCFKKVSNTPDPRLTNRNEEMQMENDDGGSKQEKNARENITSLPDSSPDSSDNILQVTAFPTKTEVQTTSFMREAVFDKSDDEGSTEQHAIFFNGIKDLEYDIQHGLLDNRPSSHNSRTINVDDTSYGIYSEPAKSHKKYPLISQAASERELEQGAANPKINYARISKPERSLQLNLENRPMSVRTR